MSLILGLKEAILKHTGHIDENLICELFKNVTRDDQTPCQLLRFTRSHLGKHAMAKPILWLECLLPTVTQILALMSKNTQLTQLANLSNLIFT